MPTGVSCRGRCLARAGAAAHRSIEQHSCRRGVVASSCFIDHVAGTPGAQMDGPRAQARTSLMLTVERGGCDADAQTLLAVVGQTEALASDVITLDADTASPRDSARHFVGAMNPNRPVIDPIGARDGGADGAGAWAWRRARARAARPGDPARECRTLPSPFDDPRSSRRHRYDEGVRAGHRWSPPARTAWYTETAEGVTAPA